MMTTYSTAPVRDLLDAFASSDPLPGGGSAAALTGAAGVSLLLMVAGMAKTRTGAPEETADLAAAAAQLRPLRETLTTLIDEDSNAYQEVIAAYRLPRGNDVETTARREAIQLALKGATTMPLQTMRACEQALRHAAVVVRMGNPNAAIDATVGARLLLAAVESAAMNVEVNLPGLKDAAFVRASADERAQLLAGARQLARDVDA
jgi:formiminotetrahydrofolate cyclodeaminase